MGQLYFSQEEAQAAASAGKDIIGAIAQQRQQSGAAAARQARIAACGRKPLLGITKKQKKRKQEYAKCAENAIREANAANRSVNIPPDGGGGEEEGSNTMMYVGIGLGIIVLGVVGFVLIRKFGK